MTMESKYDDLDREKNFCEECKEYVLNLNGHCINDDSHIVYSLSKRERKENHIKFSILKGFGIYGEDNSANMLHKTQKKING